MRAKAENDFGDVVVVSHELRSGRHVTIKTKEGHVYRIAVSDGSIAIYTTTIGRHLEVESNDGETVTLAMKDSQDAQRTEH